MNSTDTSNFFQQINNDICDCDQRCAKCGKLKRQGYIPYSPYSPYIQPIYPSYPTQITYPCTDTTTCTHQE